MSDKPFHHLQEDYEGVCALSRKQDAEIDLLHSVINAVIDHCAPAGGGSIRLRDNDAARAALKALRDAVSQ